MNSNRILSLIRYDWAINKNKFSLTMALIAIIYVCCVLLFFTSKNILASPCNSGHHVEVHRLVLQLCSARYGFCGYDTSSSEVHQPSQCYQLPLNPRHFGREVCSDACRIRTWSSCSLRDLSHLPLIDDAHMLVHVSCT